MCRLEVSINLTSASNGHQSHYWSSYSNSYRSLTGTGKSSGAPGLSFRPIKSDLYDTYKRRALMPALPNAFVARAHVARSPTSRPRQSLWGPSANWSNRFADFPSRPKRIYMCSSKLSPQASAANRHQSHGWSNTSYSNGLTAIDPYKSIQSLGESHGI
jgi:hypothetical protein